MSTKVRVFISSTVRDLANERHEVVRRVRPFDFEPVNAESRLPHGTSTRGVSSKGVESCHPSSSATADAFFRALPEEVSGC